MVHKKSYPRVFFSISLVFCQASPLAYSILKRQTIRLVCGGENITNGCDLLPANVHRTNLIREMTNRGEKENEEKHMTVHIRLVSDECIRRTSDHDEIPFVSRRLQSCCCTMSWRNLFLDLCWSTIDCGYDNSTIDNLCQR